VDWLQAGKKITIENRVKNNKKNNKTLQILKQEAGSELVDWLQAGKKLPLKKGLKVTKNQDTIQM
jgi:hypothetical protein